MNQLQAENRSDEIDLFELFQTFWQRKWEACLIINFALIVALIHTFWIADKVYEAKTTIMPLKASSNSVLSSLSNMMPGILPFPLSKAEDDLNRFINILQSRTTAETITRRLNLADLLQPQAPLEERLTFHEVVKIVQNDLVKAADNRQGLVEITAQAKSSRLAADIANAYVQHLQWYLKQNTSTESRRNRIFIEEQYQNAIYNLNQADQRLQAFKDGHKIFSLTAQIEEMITRLGVIKGNLMAKEVQLKVLKRSGIAPNNPQYKVLTFQIDALQGQIEEIETGIGNPTQLDSIPLEALPGLETEFSQLMREKTVQETLYSLLAQQYEQAKIAEANDEISFSVLDSAIPPFRRIKPKRTLNVMLGGIVGIMFATLYIMTLKKLLDRNVETN